MQSVIRSADTMHRSGILESTPDTLARPEVLLIDSWNNETVELLKRNLDKFKGNHGSRKSRQTDKSISNETLSIGWFLF